MVRILVIFAVWINLAYTPLMRLACLILVLLLTPLATLAQTQPYLPEVLDPSALTPVAAQTDNKYLQFWGNVLIDTPTLFQTTALGVETSPSKEDIEKARLALLEHYRGNGFPLARVEVRKNEDTCSFYIDEGILRSVQVYGLGWWDTFTIRTTLLPLDILQLNSLESRLNDWLASHPTYSVEYELEALPGGETQYVEVLEKRGPFVGDLRTLLQIQRHARHILHIYFKQSKEDSTLGFGLDYTSSIGFGASAKLSKPSLAMPKDHFEAKVQVGINGRNSIDPAENGSRNIYTAGKLDLRWYTPPMSGKWLRLFVDGGVHTKNDQRPDLPLDHYRFFQTTASLNVNAEFAPFQSTYFRVGHHLRHAFNLDPVSTQPYTPPEDAVHGLMVGVGLEMLLSKPRQNYRLNDQLNASFDLLVRNGTSDLVRESEIFFQKVFFKRTATYILKSRGIYLAGPTQFFDERIISDLGIGTSFDRRYFIRRGMSASGEVRFNLWGDDLQAGVFNDFALFGFIDRTTNRESLKIANVVGPAFYAYFFNAFELSLGYAIAFSTAPGPKAYEIKIGFNKVF